MRRICLFVSIILLLFFSSSFGSDRNIRRAENGARRVALVIGNSAYPSAALKNPVNDAEDMAGVLEKIGFSVVKETNTDRHSLISAIKQFGKELQSAEIGLFYYAGHGMQIEGVNYLIPVDAKCESVADVEFEAVKADRLLAQMEQAGSKLNIVILDACRDNPFRSFRSLNQGLAQMYAPKGSIVAYATAPGSVAADGSSRNGTFTSHLLKNLQNPSLTVQDVFRETGLGVMKETGEKQIPWTSSTPVERFYLADYGVVTDTPSTPSSGKAKLSVTSNVSDADVYVDGSVVGKTPLTSLSVSPGNHRVQVIKGGYDPYRQAISISPGRSASMEAHLDLSAPATGRLYVDTTPSEARIRILNTNPTFYQGIDLEPGTYTVEVSASGYETITRQVSLSAGEDKRVSFRLEAWEPVHGDRYTNSLGMEFVYIGPGSFMMGSPENEKQRDEDETQHKVTLTKGYWLQTTEVTQAQWKAVMGANPSNLKGDDLPVEEVSWNDTQVFIKKLNQQGDEITYSLPTEAQWEYAARAGTTGPFAFGACLSTDEANYNGDYFPYSGCSKGESRETTVPVGSFSPNGWGLYNMHGNVWEWCQDWYGDYPTESLTDPTGPSTSSYHVLRGGSFIVVAKGCRSAGRNWGRPDDSLYIYGFRLAASPGR